MEGKNMFIFDMSNPLTLLLMLAVTVLLIFLSQEVKQKIAEKVKNGKITPDEINETTINDHLNTANLPNPDLMIRTSGEMRISNFLLWQIAYTELYFTPIHWPDFREEEFYKAIVDYQQRERRFGKTSEQLNE